MKDKIIRQASLLTYAGVFPFWLSIGAIVMGYKHEQAVFLLSTYGAVIASFISGIHWAIGIRKNQQNGSLLLISNMMALAVWASLIIQQTKIALALQAVCFIFLFLVDRNLFKHGQIDFWFLRLRQRATLLVIMTLAVAEVVI